jgi:hypothetical protein
MKKSKPKFQLSMIGRNTDGMSNSQKADLCRRYANKRGLNKNVRKFAIKRAGLFDHLARQEKRPTKSKVSKSKNVGLWAVSKDEYGNQIFRSGNKVLVGVKPDAFFASPFIEPKKATKKAKVTKRKRKAA